MNEEGSHLREQGDCGAAKLLVQYCHCFFERKRRNLQPHKTGLSEAAHQQTRACAVMCTASTYLILQRCESSDVRWREEVGTDACRLTGFDKCRPQLCEQHCK